MFSATPGFGISRGVTRVPGAHPEKENSGCGKNAAGRETSKYTPEAWQIQHSVWKRSQRRGSRFFSSMGNTLESKKILRKALYPTVVQSFLNSTGWIEHQGPFQSSSCLDTTICTRRPLGFPNSTTFLKPGTIEMVELQV